MDYLCLKTCPFAGRVYTQGTIYDLDPALNPNKHFRAVDRDAPQEPVKGEKKAAGKAPKSKNQGEPGLDADHAALMDKAKALEVQVDDAWTIEQLAHAVSQAEANPPKLPG